MRITLQSGSLSAELDVPDQTHFCTSDGQGPQVLPSSLDVPLGLPQLGECVVAGDRVTVVIDPQTPEAPRVVGEVWERLHAASSGELSTCLVLPADPANDEWSPFVEQLPEHVRRAAAIHVHDPADENQRHYLASSAGGERLYLSQYVVDADLIITIGTIAFDSVLGYRGTNSAIYPALSDANTIAAANGQGHTELTPDNKRPLRQLVDEVGWLLGTQYTVQVIPNSAGQIGFAYSGAPDQVMQAGQACLKNHFWHQQTEHSDLTIVCLPPSLPQYAWQQVGDALATAGRITEDDGRIVLCGELSAPDSPGLTMLQRSAEPADLVKPLRLDPTSDARQTLQLITALSRHRVYLMSNLETSVVENLGILALQSADELQRLTTAATRCTILSGAGYWAEID
ncbi:MAG: lactate racemase domain-containing protein [Planctomycetaceae bacterium]|nr:lactate racemase domain-containing protein [Planctomycetaceae bacterium]